jgi:hypothetical protein
MTATAQILVRIPFLLEKMNSASRTSIARHAARSNPIVSEHPHARRMANTMPGAHISMRYVISVDFEEIVFFAMKQRCETGKNLLGKNSPHREWFGEFSLSACTIKGDAADKGSMD